MIGKKNHQNFSFIRSFQNFYLRIWDGQNMAK